MKKIILLISIVTLNSCQTYTDGRCCIITECKSKSFEKYQHYNYVVVCHFGSFKLDSDSLYKLGDTIKIH